MFGANKVSSVVENAINSNSRVNINQANASKVALISLAIAIIVLLVVHLVLGPWLWNNVLKRLVPAVGAAKWYDTVLLSILLGLLFP